MYHDEARYIGMILDTKLNWDNHLQHVLSQADRQIFAKKKESQEKRINDTHYILNALTSGETHTIYTVLI